jgi:AraC-like DNA-binding protein
MTHEMKKYPVQHPLLRKYIKFYWEIHSEHMQLHHRFIPVRNIDLKFNLSDTPHYFCLDGEEHALENVYFSGLHDHFRNAYLKVNGKVDILGICFYPDGLFPFIKIPLSEFRNQLLGSSEAGFNWASALNERLREAPDAAARYIILENELLSLIDHDKETPESFRQLFNVLKHRDTPVRIADFCTRNNLGMRKLERMYNTFVGVSARTYGTLHRFQNCMNQLLNKDYFKLFDIAYGNGYFDQMHFIKEFKRFTGITPNKFIRQNNSMLQVGKLS